MKPSELNAVARLVMVVKRCGPDVLTPARFDRLFESGSFAKLDGKVLDAVRRVIN